MHSKVVETFVFGKIIFIVISDSKLKYLSVVTATLILFLATLQPVPAWTRPPFNGPIFSPENHKRHLALKKICGIGPPPTPPKNPLDPFNMQAKLLPAPPPVWPKPCHLLYKQYYYSVRFNRTKYEKCEECLPGFYQTRDLDNIRKEAEENRKQLMDG